MRTAKLKYSVLLFALCFSFSGCVSVKAVPFYRAVLSGNTSSDRILLYKDNETISTERISRAHRSFGYKIAEQIALSDGLKKRWTYSAEKLEKYLLKTDQSRQAIPPPLYYKQITIEKTIIDGYPCYFLTPKGDVQENKVIFYLHGGGFIYEMHPMHWEFAVNLVRETSLTVCIPMYPIFPTIDPEISIHFIIECYKELLSKYDEAKIIALSDSAGSNLNMSFMHYLSLNNYSLPVPKCLILISPAMVVGNDESIIADMKQIEVHDVMLSTKMLDTLPVLFKFLEGDINWYTAPLYGDFSKFPPMYLFAGTFDMFYPQMAPFVRRVREQGKSIEFYTGYEMMHDWPVVPAVPECEAAFREIVAIINMQ